MASPIAIVLDTIANVNKAKFQEQVARNNAFISEENKQRAIFESQIGALDADEAASQELGLLIANAGASGLDLGSGSKLQAQRSKEALASRDRERIRFAGDVEGAKFEQEKQQFLAEAAFAKKAKSLAIVSGSVNLASSLISSASGVPTGSPVSGGGGGSGSVVF